MNSFMRRAPVAIVIALVASPCAHAALSVDVIAKVGQVAPGSGGATITSLNSPFTNSDGKVGFTGNSSLGNFVWYDAGIIWMNSAGLPIVLTGAEGTMGVSNAGGFIYSPSADGHDAVWGTDGLILQQGQAAPGFPGLFNSFNSRPTISPYNVAHWVAGVANTNGGATTQRVLYRRAANSGAISPLLKAGDNIGAWHIAPTGISFDYDFSDDLSHHIHVITTDADAAFNDAIYYDGVITLLEGEPTGAPGGGDELWAAFDIVGVNNAGNWIVTGNTNGPPETDEFIVYNWKIAAREGDTLDGVLLAPGFTLRAASINNNNRVVHMWGLRTNEVLFVGEGPTLKYSSVRVLGAGDSVDLNGDSVGDAAITDLEASNVIGPGVSFSDHDFIYVEVTLNDGANPEYEAIIRVPLPSAALPCPGDISPKGGDGSVNTADLLLVINSWGACPGCPADINDDGVANTADLLAVINGWGACP